MATAVVAQTPSQSQAEESIDGANHFLSKLLLKIHDHFDEQDLIDVTFKLSNPGAVVTAHRLILSSASPYFRQFFKSEAGISPLIEITNIDSDAFTRLIAFCYTGKALITIENVEQMLKGAMFLQLEDAVTECVDFVLEHITDYTLDRTYALERDTQCALLSEKILEYELKNFTSLMQSTVFLNFDGNKLKTILENEDLNIPNEKVAFEAVKCWYEHDTSAREQQLAGIISCLRLTQFDTKFLLTDIRPLPGCHFVALEALSWLNVPASRSTLSLRYIHPRGCASAPQCEESAFMALSLTGQGRYIYQYNKTGDSWQKWHYFLKTDVQAYQVIFLDENLMFIGGRRNGEAINEVSSWNLKTKSFQQLLPMNEPRVFHSVVLLNEKVYAIGGLGEDDEALDSVEMCSCANGWKPVECMLEPRCCACAVALSGKIYVMGGKNEDGDIKSVECYDPTTNCWTQCADMTEARHNSGVAVHNGQIFVVGGAIQEGTLEKRFSDRVECYDPQTNHWRLLYSLRVGFELPGCISFDNRLWTVGCFSGAVYAPGDLHYYDHDLCNYGENYRDWVAYYDERSFGRWVYMGRISLAGTYYCFIVPKALLKSEQQT